MSDESDYPLGEDPVAIDEQLQYYYSRTEDVAIICANIF